MKTSGELHSLACGTEASLLLQVDFHEGRSGLKYPVEAEEIVAFA